MGSDELVEELQFGSLGRIGFLISSSLKIVKVRIAWRIGACG